MKLSLKIILLVLLACLSFTNLTGCYDSREIDEMSYVVAVGLDKGTTNALRLTLQYAIPIATGGGGGGGGGGEPSKSVGNVTIECPSLLSGITLVNSSIAKKIDLTHAKVVVFSKELAESGDMIGYLHGMTKSRQFRPTLYIAVSRSSAQEYIESIKPVQEADPSKYYEMKFSAYKYTGFTGDTTLYRFYSAGVSSTQEPVATLVGVNDDKSTKDFANDKSTYREKGRSRPLVGDYKAGEVPRIGDVSGETMGLAAFSGAKMVGELDGRETTYYLMCANNFDGSSFTIPDPVNERFNVIISVKKSRSPSYKIDLNGGKPIINIKLLFEGDYQAVQSGVNYESDKNRAFFEKTVENFIKKGIEQFLNKTSKEFKTDICGFGRYAKIKFLTWQEWYKYDWFSKYKEATFNVSVDFKVRRPGLTIRTSEFIGTSEEGSGKK